jgi:hypothetical protein
LNSGCHGGKPATNRLSYGVAHIVQDHQLRNSQIMILLTLKMASDHFGCQMFVYVDGVAIIKTNSGHFYKEVN